MSQSPTNNHASREEKKDLQRLLKAEITKGLSVGIMHNFFSHFQLIGAGCNQLEKDFPDGPWQSINIGIQRCNEILYELVIPVEDSLSLLECIEKAISSYNTICTPMNQIHVKVASKGKGRILTPSAANLLEAICIQTLKEAAERQYFEVEIQIFDDPPHLQSPQLQSSSIQDLILTIADSYGLLIKEGKEEKLHITFNEEAFDKENAKAS